jgi:phenylalanyl-tRNA synthetase beta chain
LNHFKLFDVYKGEQTGTGKKSMALSLLFRSREKTLRDVEVEKFFERVKTALIEKTNCTVREG